eukprot:TRINITY_DN5775_c0_g1_i1.p1 TRINITY_DN5775_c0_g1~~TRINITY_DN5775_c0_g1_i1.p1  ORF type:complete len:511 (+),score=97.07 TRINITY_DN5775_c0_g1_i1:24-1535(+)
MESPSLTPTSTSTPTPTSSGFVIEEQKGQFSLGGDTLVVPMSLHAANRKKVASMVRASAPDLVGAYALFEGGKQEARHDTDHEPLFRQESYFHYMFGVREGDCFGVVSIDSGESHLFVPRLPAEYAVWMGTIFPTSHFKEVYGVDFCHYVDELGSVLEGLQVSELLVLRGQNSDSKSIHAGASFDGIEKFSVNKTLLFPACQEARVIKSAQEIEVMRYICQRSAEAHIEVMKAACPGKLEYQLESLFRHVMYEKSGCRFMSYTCICASGINGATLHYGHSGAPNARQYLDGDMMMFDMGGEYHCYGADISRSYPCNGKFTEVQKQIYNTVLASADAVMAACKPGVSYPDMHRLAERVILENLTKYGFLQGDIDAMVENHIGALFMPHGLGHLLGIDTHDVGGYVGDMKRSTEPGLCSLRLGRQLQEGMVLTIEPGVYFIRALLLPAFEDPKQSPFLNVAKLTDMLSFGGVRIEDDIVVTATGIENMSAGCPRTIEEIEAIMSE